MSQILDTKTDFPATKTSTYKLNQPQQRTARNSQDEDGSRLQFHKLQNAHHRHSHSTSAKSTAPSPESTTTDDEDVEETDTIRALYGLGGHCINRRHSSRLNPYLTLETIPAESSSLSSSSDSETDGYPSCKELHDFDNITWEFHRVLMEHRRFSSVDRLIKMTCDAVKFIWDFTLLILISISRILSKCVCDRSVHPYRQQCQKQRLDGKHHNPNPLVELQAEDTEMEEIDTTTKDRNVAAKKHSLSVSGGHTILLLESE